MAQKSKKSLGESLVEEGITTLTIEPAVATEIEIKKALGQYYGEKISYDEIREVIL